MPIPAFNIQLGPLEITGFGIMMMVGFLMGGWLIERELRRLGFRAEYSGDVVLAAVVGGVIGAKLWYVVLTQDMGALFSRGGLVWYGGFLGGVIAVALMGQYRKVPVRWTMHMTAPALAAAHGLGRAGCFMVGDDYGRPTEAFWGVQFPDGLPPTTAGSMNAMFGIPIPEGMDPATVLSVHPTQLFEVVLLLGAFMLLWAWRTKPWGTGWLFGAYLVLAGVERFLIEILRAKDDRFLGVFTIAQLTSVILVVVGVTLILRLKDAGRAEPGRWLAGK
ncbi:MAG: prolipoprotein diacylglyceryl transferase [Gemmatimonadales bacterium]